MNPQVSNHSDVSEDEAVKDECRGQIRWAAQWRFHDAFGSILWDKGHPVLFRTRQKARDWIQFQYAYIKARKDLRSAPHNWRMPRAVRVEVIINPLDPPTD